ncbi:hypothetical protein KY289_036872 [Solanum tuberosum]|nr:hypothetical protein KY289_036872 [Solanum tuberosum]
MVEVEDYGVECQGMERCLICTRLYFVLPSMALVAGGQSPPEAARSTSIIQPPLLTTKYSEVLKPDQNKHDYETNSEENSGIFTWRSSNYLEVIRSSTADYTREFTICNSGKFSYDKPDLHELRRLIPAHCEIKGPCNIGLLENRYVLIRLSLLEDYSKMMSTPEYYLKVQNLYCQTRPLKWYPWFVLEEETSIAVAWISFSDSPPNFLAREAVSHWLLQLENH